MRGWPPGRKAVGPLWPLRVPICPGAPTPGRGRFGPPRPPPASLAPVRRSRPRFARRGRPSAHPPGSSARPLVRRLAGDGGSAGARSGPGRVAPPSVRCGLPRGGSVALPPFGRVPCAFGAPPGPPWAARLRGFGGGRLRPRGRAGLRPLFIAPPPGPKVLGPYGPAGMRSRSRWRSAGRQLLPCAPPAPPPPLGAPGSARPPALGAPAPGASAPPPLDSTASRPATAQSGGAHHFAAHLSPVLPLRPGGIRLSRFPPEASTAVSGAQG